MKKYTVRPGATFRMPDGSLAEAGAVIELPSDVAATHSNFVSEVADEPAAEPAAEAGFPAIN